RSVAQSFTPMPALSLIRLITKYADGQGSVKFTDKTGGSLPLPEAGMSPLNDISHSFENQTQINDQFRKNGDPNLRFLCANFGSAKTPVCLQGK
ncbi:MAG: hypothetical protein AAGU16_09950, partial [Desulfitobacterium hafniense]